MPRAPPVGALLFPRFALPRLLELRALFALFRALPPFALFTARPLLAFFVFFPLALLFAAFAPFARRAPPDFFAEPRLAALFEAPPRALERARPLDAFGRGNALLSPVFSLTLRATSLAASTVEGGIKLCPLAERVPIAAPATPPRTAPTGPPIAPPMTAPATPPAVCLDTGKVDP